MDGLTTIGDVEVHRGEPPNGNPYRGESLDEGERLEALRAFRDGRSTEGLTFWRAPVGGGARRLASRDEVDWRGMRP